MILKSCEIDRGKKRVAEEAHAKCVDAGVAEVSMWKRNEILIPAFVVAVVAAYVAGSEIERRRH